jgi:hypothetical protein
MNGTADADGIFRGDGSSVTQIARSNQVAPGGPGTFLNFTTPAINDSGNVAFAADLTGTGSQFEQGGGIYRGSGGALTTIARTEQPSPDGDGTFGYLHNVHMNNLGQVAFQATLFDTLQNNGVFRGDGSSTVSIARTGFTNVRRINSAGQVLLVADGNSQGILRGDGDGLVGVAWSYQIPPGDTLDYFVFNGMELDDSGRVAFTGGHSREGLFLFDEDFGVTTILRAGDAFLGSTISSIDIGGYLSAPLPDYRSGFNDLGQIAVVFRLADGRSGIGLAAVPEPSGAAVCAVSALSLIRRRRRH